MKVVVTGAAGHIGGNLVRALLARGVKPRVVVRSDRRALEGLDVEVVDGDVRDPASLERAFAGAERVFHLAAHISISPGEEELVQAINVRGVKNVVEACLSQRVKRLIHFSSIHALTSDPVDTPVDEARPLADDSPLTYDRSKAGGERAIQAGIARGLDAVVVNPTGVIGPHDYRPSRMGEVFLALYHRKMPGLVAGGFNWVDVRDVVDGALAAAERGRAGERYLLSGHRLTIRELAGLVEEVTGRRAPKIVSPMWLARASAPVATWIAIKSGKRPLFTSASLAALRNHKLVSHDKASRELGYQPRPARDTISDTFAWFKEAHAL